MRGSRSAFSMIEVCLAFAILGLALVPVLGLFSGAAKHAKTTSDHSFALALAQKVAEELRVAEWENPHTAERVDPQPALAEPITEGVARQFEVIEDLAPPFGRIQPGVDPGIGPEFAALHKQASAFRVAVGGVSRALPVTGSVLDVEVSLQWTDFRGNERVVTTPVVLGAGLAADPFAPPERGEADERVVRLLYPDETGTLTTIVAARGGDLEVVRDLGDAVVHVTALTSTSDAHRTHMAELRGAAEAATDDKARARAWIAVAQAAEDRAGLSLEAMRCSAPAAKRLADTFEVARLGAPPPERITYFSSIRLLGTLSSSFGGGILSAREAYQRAYNTPLGESLPGRVRTRIGMKLIELSKLKLLTTGPFEMAPLQAFLESFRATHESRNVNLERFAEAELATCADLDSLRAAYPVPARLEAYALFTSKTFPVISRVAGAP